MFVIPSLWEALLWVTRFPTYTSRLIFHYSFCCLYCYPLSFIWPPILIRVMATSFLNSTTWFHMTDFPHSFLIHYSLSISFVLSPHVRFSSPLLNFHDHFFVLSFLLSFLIFLLSFFHSSDWYHTGWFWL